MFSQRFFRVCKFDMFSKSDVFVFVCSVFPQTFSILQQNISFSQNISNLSSQFKFLNNLEDTVEMKDSNGSPLALHKIPRWISWFHKTEPECVHGLELTSFTPTSHSSVSLLPMDLYMTQMLVSSIRATENACLAYSIEFYEKMFYPSVPCGQCHHCWITGNRK